VELTQSSDATRVKITDDGSGFDAKRTRGMGVLGMEERVKRLGADQPSIPGRCGTTITVELPLAAGGSAPPFQNAHSPGAFRVEAAAIVRDFDASGVAGLRQLHKHVLRVSVRCALFNAS